MQKLAFIFLCFVGLDSFAQARAWYVGSRHEADLLLVEMKEDSCYHRQALMFSDSVREVKRSVEREAASHLAWTPWVFNAPQTEKFPPAPVEMQEIPGGVGYAGGGDTVYLKQFDAWNGHAFSYTRVDTILVDGKPYTIHQHMTDDGWIGGRPSAVHQHIAVSELGIIYSYENWIDAHVLIMLWHEDTTKQRVLQAVYQSLTTTNSWRPWEKTAHLAARYSFENCVAGLTEEWMDLRSHLQLVSATYENVGQEIHSSVTIKNTSDRHYTFPLYFSIAPAKATIHYSDTNTVAWDLLDTHYGEHMKQMKQEVYLSPGEEISFSYIFRMHYSGSCTKVTYEGLQVYTLRSYFDWLMQEPETHLGKKYLIYPHREIRPAD